MEMFLKEEKGNWKAVKLNSYPWKNWRRIADMYVKDVIVLSEVADDLENGKVFSNDLKRVSEIISGIV